MRIGSLLRSPKNTGEESPSLAVGREAEAERLHLGWFLCRIGSGDFCSFELLVWNFVVSFGKLGFGRGDLVKIVIALVEKTDMNLVLSGFVVVGFWVEGIGWDRTELYFYFLLPFSGWIFLETSVNEYRSDFWGFCGCFWPTLRGEDISWCSILCRQFLRSPIASVVLERMVSGLTPDFFTV